MHSPRENCARTKLGVDEYVEAATVRVALPLRGSTTCHAPEGQARGSAVKRCPVSSPRLTATAKRIHTFDKLACWETPSDKVSEARKCYYL